jgi:hypothetical protein
LELHRGRQRPRQEEIVDGLPVEIAAVRWTGRPTPVWLDETNMLFLALPRIPDRASALCEQLRSAFISFA